VIALLGLIAQLSVAVHAPESAGVCEPIDITVAVRGPGSVVPAIVTPSMAPFELLRASPSPKVTVDANGQGFLAEFSYVLAAGDAGTFVVPSFTARVGRVVGVSPPLNIAINGSHGGESPGVIVRAQIDTSLNISVRTIAPPETVFVGQQTNYEVAVFLSQAIQGQLKHNPTFFPPGIQSMLAYDLPANGNSPRQNSASHCYQTLAYERAIFPVIAGRVSVPPAQLVYSVPTSSGFFSREESHQLETDSAVVVAVDPPMAGRPADYSGAVGAVRLSARLDTSVARVGDPVILTVRVTGTGNVKLFPRPSLDIPWASVVAADERVHIDTLVWRVRGTKEFDWIVTPRVAGDQAVPPIRYSYFDPDRRQYEIAIAGAPQLRVSAGTLASTDTTQAGDLLPLRTRDRGPVGRPFNEQPLFWLVLLIAPLPALGMRLRGRGRRIPTKDPANALLRLGDAGEAGAAGAAAVRRAYAAALAARLGLTSEVFSRPGAVARALRRAGASRQLATDAEQFMRELDAAAFSEGGTLPRDACARAIVLYKSADSETLSTHEVRFQGLSVVAGTFLLAGGVAGALLADSSDASFQRGIEAYRHHAYSAAQAAFALATRSAPRSPDSWANYGTASWAAGDTAHAVQGWQRAVRLDPIAPDLRNRIELVHGLPIRGAGFVLPIPYNGAFLLAAACWACAWLLAALRAHRRTRTLSRLDLGLVVLAGLALLLGFYDGDRLNARGLAVVRSATAVSTDPALGGGHSGAAMTGDVLRVDGESGVWSLVTLDDSHTGWIESANLIPLDQTDPRAD
jgi:hypothetical protein